MNASAGSSATERQVETIRAVLEGLKVDFNVAIAGQTEDITRLANEARAGEVSAVVAGGGDGTIRAVAAALVGTGTPLGILPLGTLNHFAKDLKIPLVLEAALNNIVMGRVIDIDAAEVNGRLFLNNSGLGLYPMMVAERKGSEKRAGKWLSSLWAASKALARYPVLTIKIGAEDTQLVRTTPVVFVGNNEYALEGSAIGARATLDAGQLCLYVLHRTGRLGLFRFLLSALLARLGERNDFDKLLAKEIRIETRRRRLRVTTDGELNILEGPLHYRVLQKALRVIVPGESLSGCEP